MCITRISFSQKKEQGGLVTQNKKYLKERMTTDALSHTISNIPKKSNDFYHPHHQKRRSSSSQYQNHHHHHPPPTMFMYWLVGFFFVFRTHISTPTHSPIRCRPSSFYTSIKQGIFFRKQRARKTIQNQNTTHLKKGNKFHGRCLCNVVFQEQI